MMNDACPQEETGQPLLLGVVLLTVIAMVIGLGSAWLQLRAAPFSPEAWAQAGISERTRRADGAAAYLNAERPSAMSVRNALGEPDHMPQPTQWHYHLGLFGPVALHPGRRWLVVRFAPEADGLRVLEAQALPAAATLPD